MNAIQMLLQDHREVKDLFSQFEELGKRATKKKQSIAEKVVEELKVHSQLEEQVFYPAVREAADQETEDLVLEGIEEHRIADFMMARLQETEPEDETFDAKFKALMESVQHHLKEEERKLFPEAKKILADDLDRLAEEMASLKERLEQEAQEGAQAPIM